MQTNNKYIPIFNDNSPLYVYIIMYLQCSYTKNDDIYIVHTNMYKPHLSCTVNNSFKISFPYKIQHTSTCQGHP